MAVKGPGTLTPLDSSEDSRSLQCNPYEHRNEPLPDNDSYSPSRACFENEKIRHPSLLDVAAQIYRTDRPKIHDDVGMLKKAPGKENEIGKCQIPPKDGGFLFVDQNDDKDNKYNKEGKDDQKSNCPNIGSRNSTSKALEVHRNETSTRCSGDFFATGDSGTPTRKSLHSHNDQPEINGKQNLDGKNVEFSLKASSESISQSRSSCIALNIPPHRNRKSKRTNVRFQKAVQVHIYQFFDEQDDCSVTTKSLSSNSSNRTNSNRIDNNSYYYTRKELRRIRKVALQESSLANVPEVFQEFLQLWYNSINNLDEITNESTETSTVDEDGNDPTASNEFQMLIQEIAIDWCTNGNSEHDDMNCDNDNDENNTYTNNELRGLEGRILSQILLGTDYDDDDNDTQKKLMDLDNEVLLLVNVNQHDLLMKSMKDAYKNERRKKRQQKKMKKEKKAEEKKKKESKSNSSDTNYDVSDYGMVNDKPEHQQQNLSWDVVLREASRKVSFRSIQFARQLALGDAAAVAEEAHAASKCTDTEDDCDASLTSIVLLEDDYDLT